MKIGELITELEKYDPEMEVWHRVERGTDQQSVLVESVRMTKNGAMNGMAVVIGSA